MDYLKKLTKKIFQYEAQLVLRKYKPKIIAVIGSVGKTLTKEAIYLALSKKFFVRKSEKSFTTELGIPLTIIGCPQGVGSILQWAKNILFAVRLLLFKANYPEWLILEIDADKPGDLESLSPWFRPDILVITAIGEVPSHIESFSDIENLLSEKRQIINSIKSDGKIIYNTDDSVTRKLLDGVNQVKISCGVSSDCNVSGSSFTLLYSTEKSEHIPTGMSFEILYDSKKYLTNLFQTIGIQNEYACLIAFAVGLEFGLKPSEIITSLNKYTSLPGRMNIISGIKNTVIIDDSYNSSPIAMSQALDVFFSIKTSGRKIVVLGDMLELGKYSAEEHRKLAILLKDSMDKIICVGLRMRKVSEELLKIGWNESDVISVDTANEAVGELQKLIKEGDVVLIKGSQAMRMEKVVLEIMRHPEDKKKLLVRQEKEWLER